MILPMDDSLMLQRKLDDLQRRLALLESMIQVTAKDMVIRTPGNLAILVDKPLTNHST